MLCVSKTFLYWIAFISFSSISWLYLYGSISGLIGSTHPNVYLFFHPYLTVLTISSFIVGLEVELCYPPDFVVLYCVGCSRPLTSPYKLQSNLLKYWLELCWLCRLHREELIFWWYWVFLFTYMEPLSIYLDLMIAFITFIVFSYRPCTFCLEL